MIHIKINDKEISVREGTTILAAARKIGIEIPAMCFNEEAGSFASCMVCIVKETISGKFLPSCSALVEEGMKIITDDPEVREARRMALELLLSDHLGDCQAPCQITCPAHMNIPLMNRLLMEGKTNEALQVVVQDIPFPAVLGRICPAPCEGACRRKSVDEPVSICLLKRFTGDHGIYPEVSKELKMIPEKKIAIIGAGPAGLSAAYYLSQSGYFCEIFDKNELPGGMLRYGVPDKNLPHDVLDKEIKAILHKGIKVRPGVLVNVEMFNKIVSEYDALILATGDIDDNVRSWGIESGSSGISADKNTHQTSIPKIFAVGNVLRSSKMAVRAVGHGKEAAVSVRQFLRNETVNGQEEMFNSRFGRLLEEEMEEYLKESYRGKRIEPVKGLAEGFTMQEVMQEAGRCMHCDCRDIQSCKLREYASYFGANQRRFFSESRKSITKKFIHDTVIYEPEKCIKCGICVRLTAIYKEKFGFTYIGRGFDVQIGIPFNEDLRSALTETAEKIAMSCPTGALAKKKNGL
ncbi:MAG: hypothetical protein AMS27_15270 [Bacteroides sp. SM23_62_1]|nr:MAG: hypothetical protein AMS27_15270 [Bacteroides sp. SM23_62_1]